ncbi:MAG: ThuA domain-containing protein [Candidatus Nealsonbacteria bacterium]|nr:ThuA domain-containing protein [Candidatus Nealsonbacteria bacterium]
MKHLQNCLLLSIVSLLSLVGFGRDASAEDPVAPIRVLILTGRNNHNWKATTPMLQKVLRASGKFQVDTTVPPQGLTRENLNNYDVILSDWNSWGGGSQEAEAAWTAETRRAYLDFVRGGKGHVTVHAGGSSFYKDWPEYRNVSLAYWNLGVTGHGRQHEFKVRIDKPDHPLTAGLEEFTIRDELWNKPGVVQQATVLASAYSDKQQEPGGTNQWEPSVVTATYGRGRCFATLLGHDAKIMENEGFQQLLIRGVQWAATGKVVSAVTPDAE